MVSRFVLDSSALLALLFEEPGADRAEALGESGVVSAVSYSETFAKSYDRGVPPETAHRVIANLNLTVVPFDETHALTAAAFRPSTRAHNVSFADRACLATAALAGLPVLTADRQWQALDLGVEVVFFRERP